MRYSSFLPLAIVCVVGFLGASCSRQSKLERAAQRADEYFKAEKHEAAIIEYLNVLQIEPHNIVALEKMAEIWLKRGAPMRALPYVQQVRSRYPYDRDGRLRAMQIAFGVGKLDVVRDGAVELLAQSPNHPDAIVLLTEVVRGEAHLTGAEQALKNVTDRDSAAYHLAASNIASHRGDTARVKSALQQAVKSDPKSTDARLALANFYLSAHDRPAAEEQFKAAAELAPVRSNARIRYLEYKAQTGGLAEAVEALKNLAQQAPDFFPVWRCLAQIASTQGKYDEARGHLEKIFALDPGNYESRIQWAQMQLAKGVRARAIEELERLAREFPDLAGPQFELGRAHLANKDTAKAQEALKKATSLNPDHESAMLLWAGLGLQSGQGEAVVLAMVDLLAKRPGLEVAQMMLIDALGSLGRLDDIIALIRESLRLNPERPQTHYLLGLVLLRKEKPADARQAFERTLQLAPHTLPAVAELVSLDLKERQVAVARQRIQAELEKNPDAGQLHWLDARIFAAEERWEQSEAAGWRAIAAGWNGMESHALIARSYLSRTGTDPRLQMKRLLENRANDLSALAVAGSVYMAVQDFAEAAAAYEKLLSIRPDTVLALNNLSYLYAERLGNPARGLELATKAREFDPNSPEVADTLGWILFNRREYARALELLSESAARLPTNPQVQFHFARANQMMGRVEPARAAFAKAAAANANFEGKEQIKDFLAQLDQQPATP